ncbi:MAG TPA: NAD(P)/FAD-dependent oxidoreductase [Chitinophagaceae bacterium]|nr:NAD(P)/FAD-dependent oxidoreductase [Ferruginibacter sp.]HUM97525.1 NAD(P)/FAD-dependent oxidoreductase [Chitinophagaceae bacterium]
MTEKKTVVIIGGGAAGFFCAINVARLNPSQKVVILEKSNKLLSKVRISGGGRCNVTNACFDIGMLARNYPRGANFVKKSFHHFSPKDTIDWFEERGVKLKTEQDGRVFPVTDSSQTVINCLMNEANKYGVEILMNAEVLGLEYKNNQFEILCSASRRLIADYLCIATGGYPKASMFEWLKSTGHQIEAPLPSLFTFNLPKHPICNMMGLSVAKAKIKIAGSKLEQWGPVLITHWGISGPAVIKLSAWGAKELADKNYEFSAIFNWIPDFNENTMAEKLQQLRSSQPAQKIFSRNEWELPARLWEFFCNESKITNEMRWADLPSAFQNKLVKCLCNYEVVVKGKTTFKEEFVTAGGIRLLEVEASTMKSKKISNLYFAGEVLDVDGITGGFNFQHAWTSGYIAATNIAKEFLPT